MERIKKLLAGAAALPAKKKIKIITVFVLTACTFIAAYVYAWFNMQKKAAEMFKVEYPNALYINAAHREDRIFFDLGDVDVGGYVTDEYKNTIYFDDADNILYLKNGDEILTDEYGHPLYDKEKGDAKKIKNLQYVFSVSGTNTDKFTLQMAHTTNNRFTYTVYEAKQYLYKDAGSAPAGAQADTIVPADTNDDNIVKYTTSKGSHTENTVQVKFDKYDDTADPIDLYYVKGAAVDGAYKNETSSGSGLAKDHTTSDKYYFDTYGKYENVQKYAVPLYWQAEIELTANEIDDERNFCKYFIVEVTWNEEEQTSPDKVKKETDMIYFSVKR